MDEMHPLIQWVVLSLGIYLSVLMLGFLYAAMDKILEKLGGNGVRREHA
ncbi:MAG: hypothetical protein WD061_01835 [Candidatus Saccharimonadales bacterium]